MRTTVRLSQPLFVDLKSLAAETGRSITAIIEDALRHVMSRRKLVLKKPKKLVLPTFKGKGALPGINLDNNAALLDLMDGL